MSKESITQSELKDVLNYNHETGLFTWLVDSKHRKTLGLIAGTIEGTGYICITYRRTIYKAHRLAFLYMDGHTPIEEVDHINGNRGDNRWSNLRKVTRKENRKNCRRYSTNTSGITGVTITRCGWKAGITVDYKSIHLYQGNDFLEACCARKSAESKYGFHINHGR